MVHHHIRLVSHNASTSPRESAQAWVHVSLWHLASILYQRISLKLRCLLRKQKCSEGMLENFDFTVVQRAAWFLVILYSPELDTALLSYSAEAWACLPPLVLRRPGRTWQLRSAKHIQVQQARKSQLGTRFWEATGHHVSFIKQLDPSPTFPVRSSKRMAPRLHQSQASVSSRIAPTSKHETFQLILKRSVTPSKLTYIYKVTV